MLNYSYLPVFRQKVVISSVEQPVVIKAQFVSQIYGANLFYLMKRKGFEHFVDLFAYATSKNHLPHEGEKLLQTACFGILSKYDFSFILEDAPFVQILNIIHPLINFHLFPLLHHTILFVFIHQEFC